MIPTVDQCMSLMGEYRMLDNIRLHSMVVARVAGFLCTGLQPALDVSMERVVAGALLHDIAKTQSLASDGDHAEMGADLCRRHGFDEVADIVGQHVILDNGVPERPGEREIVYYADKRVMHENIVGLDKRLTYILERYGRGDSRLCRRIEDNFNNCRLVEKKLFALLPYSPEDVAGLINGHPFVFQGLSI